MNLFNLFQFMDVWTPSPVENAIYLLAGILIYSLPIIIAVVIILIVKKNKNKKSKEIVKKDINHE